MRIGVFDSGIGGLTVLKNLYKNYPNNDYIYYGDTLNLPYGSKSIEKLQELAKNDIEFLLTKNIDIIIIACGTVSSNCINYLKNKYTIPIYDVISPTINYLNKSNYKNIGIIATNATIDSKVFSKNINKNVYEIKTPKLVPIIENNEYEILNETLKFYLEDYKNKIEILVLGCTHYPIITNELSKYLPKNIELLDMSNLLLDKLSNDKTSSITIYYSKLTNTIINNTKKILEIDDINIYNRN